MQTTRTKAGKPPAYLEHSAKDRGFSYYRDDTGRRRRRYFPGAYGSPESRRGYLEFLNVWEAGTLKAKPATKAREHDDRATVGEIAATFLDFADGHYVKNGRPTGTADNFRDALRPVVELFGDTLAEDFGPKRLVEVRDAMDRGGRLSRKTINHRIGKVRQVFKWAVAEELVPSSVYEALRAVSAIQHGRAKRARESPPVEPVAGEQIDAVLPLLTPTLAAMVRFAFLTGARPGEVCGLRWRDVDRADPDAWVYRVRDHKNYHRGHERVIGIGRTAQLELEPFLDVPPDDLVFSPQRSERERRALGRQQRVTPLTPSQSERDRRRADNPRRVVRDRWTSASFCQAIHRACARAGVPPWNPGQLRHNFENRAEPLVGLENTSRAMGHSVITTTEHYRSKRKVAAAKEVAKLLG